MTSNTKNRPPFYQALLAACFFGLLWGSWAFFSNRAHGTDVAAKAMITQFSFSFVATFIFALAVDHLYSRNQTLSGKILFAAVLPVGVMIGLVSAVHYFRGTPSILMTIAPPSTVAALYCVIKIAKGHLSGLELDAPVPGDAP